MKKLQTYVEDETMKSLKRLASVNGITMGEVLDLIVKRWVEHHGDLREEKK